MAAFAMRRSTWELQGDVEWIDVTSGLPTPKEDWRFKDRNGHEHHYDHGYPTLELVVDESHWCLGNEGLGAHDPHEAVDESHYECLICRVTVKPKMDPPGTPRSVRGLTTWTLRGYRSDGVWVAAHLIGDEVRRLSDDEDNSVAAAILDAVPPERIIETRFASR